MEEKVSAVDSKIDPLSVLSANCESLECASTMIIGAHNKCTFQVTLRVNKKRRYVAIASSALLAKRKAASVALEEIRTKSIIQDPSDTPRESSRIFVKDIGQLLNIPEGATSNDVGESIEAECNEISAIEVVPTNVEVTKSTDIQFPPNVENMNRIFDDELPTTSKNAAKHLSAQKRQDAANVFSPSMKKPKIQEFKESTMEKLENHKDKKSGSKVNNNQLNAMDSNKASTSPDDAEIMNEAGVDTNSDEQNHSDAPTVIELIEDTPNSIMEKIHLEDNSVVADMDEETVREKSVTPTVVDLETEGNKSVEEIVNECISQILDNPNSSEVVDINDDGAGSDKEEVILNVEGTNSDDDSAVVEIDEERTEDDNGDLTEHSKNTPSSHLEIIEIHEDTVEPSNSPETVDVDAVEIDYSQCPIKLVKQPPTSTNVIGFGDNSISPDVEINKSGDASNFTIFRNVKRRVTMQMRGGMAKKFRNMKQKRTVNRFIKNPVNFHGDISEGTQQVYMPPTKVTPAFKKPILKTKRTYSNFNATYLNQKKNNWLSPNINRNTELAEMNEENIVQRLNQICPGIRYNMEAETISSGNSFFLMSATLNDRKYFGDGQTRSEASMNVATKIMRALNNIITPRIPCDNPEQVTPSHVRSSVRPQVQFVNQDQVMQSQIRRNVIPQVQFVRPSTAHCSGTPQVNFVNAEQVTQFQIRRNVIQQVEFVKPSHVRSSVRPEVQFINQKQVTHSENRRNVIPHVKFVNQEEVTEPPVRFSNIPQNPFVRQAQPTQSHGQNRVIPQRYVRRNDIPQMSSSSQRQPVQKQVRFDVTPQIRFFTRQEDTDDHGRPNIGCHDSTTGFNMSTLSLPQHQADVVEKLVLNHYRLVNSGNTKFHNYEVLAGIVMTHSLNFENAQVVAISTGAQCVNAAVNIDYNGCVLNDCHAVVIARRCLMKYLYTQLRWHCFPEWAEKSIFVRNPSGLQYVFSLKPDVQFHLYISTAPCGDARVFGDRNNYEQYGQLRTKVDVGMDTNTIGNRFLPQTLDGINPLLTMSCSDKIVRWNVLGIQGSLLSTLVEPIYLYSIVLGTKFHTKHLYRAVCGRLEQKLNFLPKPYHLNRPLLGQTSAATQLHKNNGVAFGLGMNWTFGDDQIELVSLARGVLQNNEVSYLSKQVLFSKYIYLLQHLPKLCIFPYPNNYAKAKELARDYETAKQEMFDAFQHAGLGCWVKKPLEKNLFSINL